MNTGYFYHHYSCLEIEEYKIGRSFRWLEDGGTLKDIVKSGEISDLWWKKISELIFGGKYDFSEHFCSLFSFHPCGSFLRGYFLNKYCTTSLFHSHADTDTTLVSSIWPSVPTNWLTSRRNLLSFTCLLWAGISLSYTTDQFLPILIQSHLNISKVIFNIYMMKY